MDSPETVNIKQEREKFNALFKQYVLNNINSTGMNVLKLFKDFYTRFELEQPKSIKLDLSKNVVNIIEKVKDSSIDSIFKRLLKNSQLIKSSYINNNNLNIIDYNNGEFSGTSFKDIENTIFQLYLSFDENTRKKIINFHTIYINTTIQIVVTLDNGTFKTKKVLPFVDLPRQIIKPTKILNKIFDIVKAHQSELMAAYCQIYENEKKKELNNFCIVRGELIHHYYNSKNYVKKYTEASTLHKSCMRSSKAPSFYSIFPNEVGMLSLYSKEGRLKGRALVWEAYKISTPETKDIKEAIKGQKMKVVDRIYYDCEDTYNLFITYIRQQGWESSYNQRGLQKTYCAVKLSIDNKSALNYFINKTSRDFPYMDSFTSLINVNDSPVLHNINGPGWADFWSTFSKFRNWNALPKIEDYSKIDIKVKKLLYNNINNKGLVLFIVDGQKKVLNTNTLTCPDGHIPRIIELLKVLKSEGIISENKGLVDGDIEIDLDSILTNSSPNVEQSDTRIVVDKPLNNYVDLFYRHSIERSSALVLFLFDEFRKLFNRELYYDELDNIIKFYRLVYKYNLDTTSYIDDLLKNRNHISTGEPIKKSQLNKSDVSIIDTFQIDKKSKCKLKTNNPLLPLESSKLLNYIESPDHLNKLIQYYFNEIIRRIDSIELENISVQISITKSGNIIVLAYTSFDGRDILLYRLTTTISNITYLSSVKRSSEDKLNYLLAKYITDNFELTK